MKFENRDIVITGGASGIGKAIAIHFARLGSHVHIVDLDERNTQEALPEISRAKIQEGQRFTSYICDVTDLSAVENVFRKMKAGGINPTVLINSAGMAYPGYVDQLQVAVYEKVMKLNYLGTVNTVKTILPFLLEQKEGYIVNIGSLCGLISIFGYTAYGASKFAVRGFTEALRCELRFKNIYVSMLCPPDTETPQLHLENKLKPPETFIIAGTIKPMTPQEVAAALIQGMKKRKFLIIPGFLGKVAYLSNRIFPSLVDKVLELKLREFYEVQKRKKG